MVDLDTEVIGAEIYVEVCPECGLLHLGPVVPWHAYDCSAPDLVRFVARIEKRAESNQESKP